MRTVIITPRARRQLTAAVRWWLAHRDKAPEAFDEDVAAGIGAISESPSIHSRIDHRRGIRRMLFERIRYYIYYRISVRGDVEIISVWHASRRPPRL
jgi:plasmid stabilization system protein ParE